MSNPERSVEKRKAKLAKLIRRGEYTTEELVQEIDNLIRARIDQHEMERLHADDHPRT